MGHLNRHRQCLVIGNIAALKYTANMKYGQQKKKSDLDKLNELDKNNTKTTTSTNNKGRKASFILSKRVLSVISYQ